MNQRAIAYIRVSTTRQAEEGVSMEAQKTRTRQWCACNGYDLVNTFVDAGISGKRADNRPGLRGAIDAACKQRGTALVVYSLSRLARSTRDAISIAERLDKSGADLVSLSEKLDTTSASGKMLFRLLAVLAEFERDLVSERTTAALAHKRHNGERTGGIPYGWRLADDATTLVAIEAEQAIIADIKAMRTAGRSYRAIADELTERAVPTKKGGPRWAHQAVARIVRRNGQSP